MKTIPQRFWGGYHSWSLPCSSASGWCTGGWTNTAKNSRSLMAVFLFFCWLSFSWVPGRATQNHVKMETPSSVGRTGQKCAPAPAESPSRTFCRTSLLTIHNLSPWCFRCHCGVNWRREMKWNKRMKEGYPCLDLIISAEKNEQSWQWETKSLRSATPGRESSIRGKESINMCFATNCISIYCWTLPLFY